ncbi:hypothetical protein CIPAW_15G039400 [Carya illinoinensis]|uniref:Uncharacterized protein n=1 Tax=Carya illinoinensis TaxID=32201 RepID=A0A8T1N9Y6_CARIL|nr:hypothetical protein CIPAW_15G039400 [Carya illinoinensis]
MADKPSRALVLYGYGLARFISPSHDHLHSLASKASCAVVITKNSTLKVFGAKLGLIVLESNDLVKNLHSLAKVPADVVASELLNLLGFKEGKTLETSEYNLVCVYVGDGGRDMEYVNALVGDIMKIAQPGSEIGSRLHLSLVMSYGHVPEDNDPNLPVLTTKDEKKSDLLMLWSLLDGICLNISHKCYTMRGENQREDVRHHFPILITQWQYGVTRKDMAEMFSFKDFLEHGGNLAIPADRFLHEVAFKIWKAPKYGA